MKSTLQSLKKIPTVSGLYRHENGAYYGKKKIAGKKIVRALVTANGANITDRKFAEKALAAWIASLTAPAPSADAGITFAGLWQKFIAQRANHATATLMVYDWVKKSLEEKFPAIWGMRVTEIKPSHLAEFYAKWRKNLAPGSFNKLSSVIKSIFVVAVTDEIISANPHDKVPKTISRMKDKRPPDKAPTIEQCEAIVNSMREHDERCGTAGRGADMVALMHLAALGQAEIIQLDWENVLWNEGRIIIGERQKTGTYFEIPIYPFLEPFLIDLWERQGKPAKGRLVSIKSPDESLASACKRLRLPVYSPRAFRKARIVWWIRKGVPVEYIAKLQNHSDNGALITRVYSYVITSLDKSFETAQLAKML